MYKTEEERKAARAETYRKRNIRRINFALNYMEAEREEGERLKRYLAQTNQSANSYIKNLVKADLDSKNFE